MVSHTRTLVVVAALLVVGAVVASAVRWAGDDGGPGQGGSGQARPAAAEQEPAEEHAEGEEEEEGEELPGDFALFERIFTGGPVTGQTFDRAWTQAQAVARETRRDRPRVAGKPWRFVGPTNIGGRVADVAVDPVLEDTLYVAAASGGVWKSTDAGDTFQRIWGNRMPQAMGALAITPDGTLYAGTGETDPGGGSLTYGGNGVYKSTDRGKTWTHVGLGDTSTIARIVIDPSDPDHVLVAASGNLFTPGGQRGLYESHDAGQTWERTLRPANPTTGAVDIQVAPDDPDDIYVAMWDHIRVPGNRDYAGPGSGIYRSTDGGAHWQRLDPTNGLPPKSETVGRIGVGMDPQNPQRLYALYISDLGTFLGFFVSDDGGDTWTEPPGAAATLAESQSVYGWWFGRVWVDPGDSDHVFVGGVPLMESTDGGQTFSVRQSEQHVDQQAMAWDPHNPGRVYLGNDGGLYRSEKDGAAGSWIEATHQPWSQFYTIDVSSQDPSRVNGGLQDEGSVRSWGGQEWNRYNGGDGVKNAINPTDRQNVFACSQYGSCSRSDDGGDTMQDMRHVSTRNGWLTPIEFQPGDTDVMYWAGNVVNRSTDRGRSWRPISPDLGEGEQGGETNPLYANHYGTVQAIELNRSDPNVIYAGTDTGLLWKTTDRGGSWRKVEDPALPDRWLKAIEVSPRDPRTVYVVYSGYRQGDDAAYVLRSRDGGKSWTDLSANLPQAPVNDIALVNDSLYLASDVGVFATRTDRTRRWYQLGSGLPRTPVNDLRYLGTNDTLYAGTFGRGVYAIEPPPRF